MGFTAEEEDKLRALIDADEAEKADKEEKERIQAFYDARDAAFEALRLAHDEEMALLAAEWQAGEDDDYTTPA